MSVDLDCEDYFGSDRVDHHFLLLDVWLAAEIPGFWLWTLCFQNGSRWICDLDPSSFLLFSFFWGNSCGQKLISPPCIFLTCHHVRQNLHSQEAPAALRRGRQPECDQPALPQQEHQWAAWQNPAQSERGSLRAPPRVQTGQLSAQRWRRTRRERWGRERPGRAEVRLWDACTSPHRTQSEVSTHVEDMWLPVCCFCL